MQTRLVLQKGERERDRSGGRRDGAEPSSGERQAMTGIFKPGERCQDLIWATEKGIRTWRKDEAECLLNSCNDPEQREEKRD